jgi:hypothetical protein
VADGIDQSPVDPLAVDEVVDPDVDPASFDGELRLSEETRPLPPGEAPSPELSPPEPSPPEPSPPEPSPPEPSPPEPADDPEAAPALAARRSFFAQPEPLKWMAGAANAFRTGPLPQSGQLVGPSSCRPWITSKRRPQAAQM